MLRKHRQRHRMLGLLDLLGQQNCTNRLQLIKDVSAVSLSIPDINFSDRHLGRQKVLPEVLYFYVCLQFFLVPSNWKTCISYGSENFCLTLSSFI